MTTQVLRRNIRLLVINPNSSHEMTHGIERAIRSMDLPDSLEITLYTAPPESPASIDNNKDIEKSTAVVWDHLESTRLLDKLKDDYDGVLVACYSSHHLVPDLLDRHPRLAVTGIFEASVAACLPLLVNARGPTGAWGIVTTGQFWEAHLAAAVKDFLGQATREPNANFLGVFSTGLTAGDFHGGRVTPEVIRAKLREATLALLRKGTVECVVMGCAGMAGLEEIIRSAAREEYKPDVAARVHIIDGVRAGVGVLEQMVKHKRMFLPN